MNINLKYIYGLSTLLLVTVIVFSWLCVPTYAATDEGTPSNTVTYSMVGYYPPRDQMNPFRTDIKKSNYFDKNTGIINWVGRFAKPDDFSDYRLRWIKPDGSLFIEKSLDPDGMKVHKRSLFNVMGDGGPRTSVKAGSYLNLNKRDKAALRYLGEWTAVVVRDDEVIDEIKFSIVKDAFDMMAAAKKETESFLSLIRRLNTGRANSDDSSGFTLVELPMVKGEYIIAGSKIARVIENREQNYIVSTEDRTWSIPKNEVVYENCNLYKAASYAGRKIYGKAIALYESCLEEHPGESSLLKSIGSVYFRSGEYTKAIDTFEKIRDTQDQGSDIYHYLGNAYVLTNRLEKGFELYQKYIELNPDKRSLIESKMKDIATIKGDKDKLNEYKGLKPYLNFKQGLVTNMVTPPTKDSQ
ncbi:MAG: tetratricopeptide (TPR) repeat protein [Limisphaerales bacterium]|jgi:tetratricopeptide (TPR) repeat protein